MIFTQGELNKVRKLLGNHYDSVGITCQTKGEYIAINIKQVIKNIKARRNWEVGKQSIFDPHYN